MLVGTDLANSLKRRVVKKHTHTSSFVVSSTTLKGQSDTFWSAAAVAPACSLLLVRWHGAVNLHLKFGWLLLLVR